MILDNFGLMVAAHFRTPVPAANSSTVIGLIDEDGVSHNFTVYRRSNVVGYNELVEDSAQVGQGTTPPVRSDFDIETPFVGGVEATKVASATSSYIPISEKVNSPTLISPTTNNDSVTEVIKWAKWGNTGNIFQFAIFRDILSVAKPFLSGQAINVAHEVTI